MAWKVRHEGREFGPISEAALQALARSGRLKPATLVWREGLPDWTPAGSVPGLLAPPPTPSLRPRDPVAATPVSERPARPSAMSASSTPRSGAAPPAAPARTAAPPLPARESPEESALAAPWPRFWARHFDMLITVSFLAALVGAVVPSISDAVAPGSGRLNGQLLGWILLPFAMVVDAGIYAAFGTTLGKAIVGVSVRDSDGGRLGLARYLRRNFGVWWAGLGTGFPLVSLVTLSRAYGKAKTQEPLSWEEATDARSLDVGVSTARTTLAAVLYIAITAALVGFGEMNPTARSARTHAPASRPPAASGSVTPDTLSAAVDEVNKTTPKMVDRETQLDRASAGPGLTFTYHYTLLNTDASRFDAGRLATALESMDRLLRKQVCGSESLKPMLEHGVTVKYSYVDKAGAPIGTFGYTQASCATT